MRILSSLLACFAAVAAFAAAEVGKPAPDFTGKTLDGKTVSLADYKGKTVVLEWYNPGCPVVKKFYDAGKMQEYQKQVIASGGAGDLDGSAAGNCGYGYPGGSTNNGKKG